MKPYYSDVIQYRGSHYDFGYFQGGLLQNSPILPNREKQWKPRKNWHFLIDPETYKDIIKNIAPALLEEIRGLADALHLDMEKAFRLFSGYYLERTRS